MATEIRGLTATTLTSCMNSVLGNSAEVKNASFRDLKTVVSVLLRPSLSHNKYSPYI